MSNNLRTNPGEPADDTAPKQRGIPFKPGQSGNPNGRPRGARNKLGERFLDDLLDAWEDKGKTALEACATKEPAQFCKIVAGVLPKEVLLTALNVNANFDLTEMENARGFFEAFKYARERIGAVPPDSAVIDLNPEAEIAWRTDDDS
jgi:hypothetical protein